MTPEELDANLRFEGYKINIRHEVDSFTACRALDVSISTLKRMIRDGTAPPFKLRNRRRWFSVEALSDWMNAN